MTRSRGVLLRKVLQDMALEWGYESGKWGNGSGIYVLPNDRRTNCEQLCKHFCHRHRNRPLFISGWPAL